VGGSRNSQSGAEPPESIAARVRASFGRQAMMATLGVRLTAVERGRVELVMDHDDRFTQQHGFLHAVAVACACTVSGSDQVRPSP
jgi:acyl-coenzyme A thioesterase PaaI-like protein